MTYNERKVSFAGKDGFQLDGTFCLPEGEVKGVALIVAGSGPTDRNGNSSLAFIPGNRYLGEINLYKDMAHHLAEQGIATLRYDKRACWGYRKQWRQFLAESKGKERLNAAGKLFSFGNITSDAEMARETLLSQPESKKLPLSLIGHSEGGLIAMRLAEQRPADNLILLAAMGRSMGDILKEQLFNRSLELTGNEERAEDMVKEADRAMNAVKEGQPLPKDMPRLLRSLFNETTRPHFEQILPLDPVQIAKKITSDVLVINGTNDIQVNAEKDARILYEAFAAREGKHRQDLVLIKGASHCFKYPASSNDTKTSFSGPVAPELFTALDAFIDPLGKYMKRNGTPAAMQR